MKTEYEKALEAARDVIYGGSNIDPLDADDASEARRLATIERCSPREIAEVMGTCEDYVRRLLALVAARA